MVSDLSEHYNLIKAQNERLQQELMTTTTSHEMRTPLNSMIAMLDAAKTEMSSQKGLEHLDVC